ncbi:thermonuclease family protein, partial [Patulibacter sp. S7RM1-6]
ALAAPGARARVVRTVDGDTAILRFRDAAGTGTATVRYLGVDTPESVHPRKPVECFGPAAARANRRWATGRLVTLRFDRERTDPYGRLLAGLRPVGDRSTLSARLLATGHARVLTIPPNGRDAPALRRLERAARRARRGMWGACRDGLRSDG